MGCKMATTLLLFSLLNIRSTNDSKLLTLDHMLENEILQFFTELNVKTAEHRNIVTSNSAYVWNFISPEKDYMQRIGFRYPTSVSKFIQVHSVESKYITQ